MAHINRIGKYYYPTDGKPILGPLPPTSPPPQRKEEVSRTSPSADAVAGLPVEKYVDIIQAKSRQAFLLFTFAVGGLFAGASMATMMNMSKNAINVKRLEDAQKSVEILRKEYARLQLKFLRTATTPEQSTQRIMTKDEELPDEEHAHH